MAGVFEIEGIDEAMQPNSNHHVGQNGSDNDEDNDIVIAEEYTKGPDFREMNASIIKDPSMEALELSERTVPGKAGKAGPGGNVFSLRNLRMSHFANYKTLVLIEERTFKMSVNNFCPVFPAIMAFSACNFP